MRMHPISKGYSLYHCNLAIMVDESYMGKRCYYYMAAAVAIVAFVVVADDDLVQISIDTSVLGKH
jgi:hypothetical protein